MIICIQPLFDNVYADKMCTKRAYGLKILYHFEVNTRLKVKSLNILYSDSQIQLGLSSSD